MKLPNLILSVFLGALVAFVPLRASAQERAIIKRPTVILNADGTWTLSKDALALSQKGKKVTLHPDGTWEYVGEAKPLKGILTFVSKWGSRGTQPGQFYRPSGIGMDRSGNLYVADKHNHRIQKFDASGRFLKQWECPPYEVQDLVVDSRNTIYVTVGDEVLKFDTNGRLLGKWGEQGTGNGQFKIPDGIAIDKQGHVYVADMLNHRIQKFTPEGEYITQWGKQGFVEGEFNQPSSVAIDLAGNLYVVDAGNKRIQKFTAAGRFITSWGKRGGEDGQFWHEPRAVFVDGSGNVFVGEKGKIQRFDTNGKFLSRWGKEGGGEGEFQEIEGLFVDNSRNVFISDTGNDRIQKFRLE